MIFQDGSSGILGLNKPRMFNSPPASMSELWSPRHPLVEQAGPHGMRLLLESAGHTWLGSARLGATEGGINAMAALRCSWRLAMRHVCPVRAAIARRFMAICFVQDFVDEYGCISINHRHGETVQTSSTAHLSLRQQHEEFSI